MSLLSWNYRELGNPQTVIALKKAIRIKKPKLVFLMETKSDKEWMVGVRDRCGFKESFVVPSQGASGGLALFWNSENKVMINSSSQSHIDAKVAGDIIGGEWHLTGFYANLETSLRLDSWRLSFLCDGSGLPWLVIGDFNEIVSASVKEGGAQRPNQQMVSPMWLQDQRCEGVLVDVCRDGLVGGSDFPILSCLESCRHRLEDWNVAEFEHMGREISRHQRQLEELELQATSPGTIKALRETRVELNCWLEKEGSMWRQRSRQNWFRKGDRNTRFFHAKASSHFQKNFIEGVFDSNKVWQKEKREVEDCFVKYYSELFTSSNSLNFSEIVEAVQPKVSSDMNLNLIKEFVPGKVQRALKQMYPLKAPSLDNDSIIFCKATKGECDALQRVLNVYEQASGQ
ncbi:uncharacterized protein LOC142629462 [Castanea sativa]|uniref:uncharacterized protein LOC142629462 n=1 Tax=Castanea sativa TaxID=21020 RepID=UPI003F64F55E